MIIAPSILACDFLRIGEEIQMIERSEADWIHCDVMDGVFVPNISFGMPILQAIHKVAQKPLDVHLMIIDPDRYLNIFQELGAYILTVHYESCTHLHRTLQSIRKLGMRAGVALNPHTPVYLLQDCLYLIDVVCVMSVNPGFGGQAFIEYTYQKVQALKVLISEQGTQTLIEIDGGVNLNNASKLKEAGADVLVAGNFVFSNAHPLQVIHQLKQL